MILTKFSWKVPVLAGIETLTNWPVLYKHLRKNCMVSFPNSFTNLCRHYGDQWQNGFVTAYRITELNKLVSKMNFLSWRIFRQMYEKPLLYNIVPFVALKTSANLGYFSDSNHLMSVLWCYIWAPNSMPRQPLKCRSHKIWATLFIAAILTHTLASFGASTSTEALTTTKWIYFTFYFALNCLEGFGINFCRYCPDHRISGILVTYSLLIDQSALFTCPVPNNRHHCN